MNGFSEGQVVTHKSTRKTCVIIEIVDDKTVKVRTSDDEEKEYRVIELEPQSETSSFIAELPDDTGYQY